MMYEQNISQQLKFHQRTLREKTPVQNTGNDSAMKKVAIPEDWETYTNQKYSFALQHPSTMTPTQTVRGKTTLVTFQRNTLTLEIMPTGATPTKVATDSSQTEDKETMTFNTMEWEVTEVSNNQYRYQMEKDGNIYTFTTTKSEDMQKTLEMILSSFTFEEVTPTTQAAEPTRTGTGSAR